MKMLNGKQLEKMEPESMQFRDKPSNTYCAGCVFEGQYASVCHKAATAANKAGMRDCVDGVIYVLIDLDIRQMSIIDDVV